VGELVGGERNLRADDVEHLGRIPKPEIRSQNGLRATVQAVFILDSGF
jgi:hypothetical protein